MRVAAVSVVLLGICALVAPVPSAQGGRKVYISVDLEGISGINGNDQTSAGQPEYADHQEAFLDPSFSFISRTLFAARVA